MKLSIIIATYNSMKILPQVIGALHNQTLNKHDYEILLVDGGSTDDTLKFGREKGLTIIENPRKEPVYAKYLGYNQAKGKYLMYLDHDEVIENSNSLKLKLDIFENHKNIKAIAPTGYLNPKGYHYINNYINEFGDPFSFFIYKISKNKDFYIRTMKAKYSVEEETDDFVIFNIKNTNRMPLIELLAGGSIFDLEYTKKAFPETTRNPELLTHLFYLITKEYPYFCITKDDAITHYSSDTLKGYFKKISWRIKNNIYFKDKLGQSGFSGREKYESNENASLKKYLFIPYSFTLLWPLLDAIYLCTTRKNKSYLIHIPLTLYTAYQITLHLILNSLGYKPELKTYDGKTKIGKI